MKDERRKFAHKDAWGAPHLDVCAVGHSEVAAARREAQSANGLLEIYMRKHYACVEGCK